MWLRALSLSKKIVTIILISDLFILAFFRCASPFIVYCWVWDLILNNFCWPTISHLLSLCQEHYCWHLSVFYSAKCIVTFSQVSTFCMSNLSNNLFLKYIFITYVFWQRRRFLWLYTFTWIEDSHWICFIRLVKDCTLGKLQVTSRVFITTWYPDRFILLALFCTELYFSFFNIYFTYSVKTLFCISVV